MQVIQFILKNRFDQYHYEGPYFYDLIKNNNYIEINRYIPGELLVNFFSYSFSIFSYSVGYAYCEGISRKKYSENISNLIVKVRW